MSSDAELTIIDLFIQELASQLNSFEKLIDTASENDVDEMIRVAHSIKGASRLVQIEEIAELGDTLEQVFKGVKKRDVALSDSLIQSVKEAIRTLRTLVDEKKDPSLWVKQQKDTLVNLITDLNAAEGGYQRGKEGVDGTRSHSSDPLQQCVQKKINLFNEAFKKVETGFHDLEAVDQMITIAKEIREVALQYHRPEIATLSGAFETCFKAARIGGFTWTRSHYDLLVEAASYLNRYCHVSVQDQKEWFKKNKSGIESVVSIIQALSQQSTLEQDNTTEALEEVTPLTISPVVQKESSADLSLLELFFGELENYITVLNDGLSVIEAKEDREDDLEKLMRAAHSLKGAARTVQMDLVVRLAHAMEDYLSALQTGTVALVSGGVDILLEAVDLLMKFSKAGTAKGKEWLNSENNHVHTLIDKIVGLTGGTAPEVNKKSVAPAPPPAPEPQAIKQPPLKQHRPPRDRVLRVSSDNLNRLMGLAGESVVESRWLQPFGESLARLKRDFNDLHSRFSRLNEELAGASLSDRAEHRLHELRSRFQETRNNLTERLADFDMFMRRHDSLSDRLYNSVLDSRMRPFADGVGGFPRMVRDLGRQLNKKVQLIIEGSNTPVDREILEKLESPLTHILRNAVDHGIETIQERRAAGKPEDGLVIVEAMHKAGMLMITITDDGRGINYEELREKVIAKNLVTRAMGEKLSEQELLDFMFLPGFSTAKTVTDVSGRGVGLNVVQSMVQEVGGNIRVNATQGAGMRFILQLPLTLSVIRALLVEISGEIYAFPLGRIDKLHHLPRDKIEVVEHRQYFRDDDKNIGLIAAHQFLDLPVTDPFPHELSVIIVSDLMNTYGVVVNSFVGEKELVVQDLDPLLGKVPDIYSGAFLEDGSPVLIIDVEDMVRSIDNLLSRSSLSSLSEAKESSPISVKQKRILVVDDSITVREVESRLLQNHGFAVDTAVNGVDGWNAVRVENYDLVITDVDMPRMNGIEFVKMIKADPRLKAVPVMIVSYKERNEDREQGLQAGANYYLTKSSFHDDTLLDAVRDLIGDP
ncbi:MAG: Hpt domain-containing protein [Chlamydiales bacterium]|nr:Hpt domain-containing protein [Chlamydiia bacterium]MCP5508335.1 Hpt domain-containing protein [Chlamydiales bacterium]